MKAATRQDAINALALVKAGKIETKRRVDQSLGNGSGGHVIISRVGKFSHAWGIDDPRLLDADSRDKLIHSFWKHALPDYANRDIKAYIEKFPNVAHTVDEDGVIYLDDDDDKVHFLLLMTGTSL